MIGRIHTVFGFQGRLARLCAAKRIHTHARVVRQEFALTDRRHVRLQDSDRPRSQGMERGARAGAGAEERRVGEAEQNRAQTVPKSKFERVGNSYRKPRMSMSE